MNKHTYTAENFEIHEGLDHVKKRPAMYIGNTEEKGLHHLIWEIIDNATDEIMNGYGNNIKVTLYRDGSISVRDNGRGIPVDIHKEKGLPAVRCTFEILGSGGKFGSDAYRKSGGLHGVGASVVNALSSKVEIKIWKDNYRYTLSYRNSILDKELKQGGRTKETGTEVRFWPDKKIFGDCKFSHSIIVSRLRELSFLNKGLKIEYVNEIKGTSDIFIADGGCLDFLKYECEAKSMIGKPFYFTKNISSVDIEVALQYSDDYNSTILSFVNSIPTVGGGKHAEGFKTALTRGINEIVKRKNEEKKRGKKELQIQGSDTQEGLFAIVSIGMEGPIFGGQTKDELMNPEIKGTVMSAVYEGLLECFSSDEKSVKAIIDKVTQNLENREKMRNVREVQKKSKTLGMDTFLANGKYAACSSKDPEVVEIFVVEGDSAGGSAKQGRNKTFQAILPLKGKPLNVEKKTLKDILDNDELRSLISVTGGEFGNSTFDISKVKSKKIIIMTDADVDGWHIQLILITFFYRYMRPLIEAGYIYIATPPLYKVYTDNKFEYAYNDKELEASLRRVGRGAQVQRYKGLGEMDFKQLWDTTMDPEKRTLIKLMIDDAAKIDRDIALFMGSKVEPRREFLLQNM